MGTHSCERVLAVFRVAPVRHSSIVYTELMRSSHSNNMRNHTPYIMNAKNHAPPDQLLEEMETLLARINALEVTSKDEFQTSTTRILRELVKGQIHSLNEFAHLKKAIDMVTLEIFKVSQVVNQQTQN